MRALVLLFCLFATSLWATNGFSQIGWGAKSQGMGGVGIALPQDAFAVAMNPAGMGFLCNRIDLDLQTRVMKANLRIRPFQGAAFHHKYSTQETIVRPSLGLNWRLGRCMSLGGTIYRLGGFQIDYGRPLVQLQELQLAPSAFPTQSPTRSLYEVYMVSPSWSWTVNRCHTIGASLNIALSWLEWEGIQPLANAQNSASPSRVTNQGVDFLPGLGLSVGWIGKLTGRWHLGLSYRTQCWTKRASPYAGFIAGRGRFDLPAQVGLGTAYWICPNLVVSADATRIFWAQTRMWRQDQQRTGLYGSDKGRGFGWKDQWIVKVGIAWDPLSCLTLRGGWNYGDIQTGGPENLINSLTQGVIEHHFTAGLTWRHKNHELTLCYVHELFHNMAYFDLTNDRHIKLKAEQKVAAVQYGVTW